MLSLQNRERFENCESFENPSISKLISIHIGRKGYLVLLKHFET